ncbi:flagellar hook-associated protein 1 [Desulfosporosinus acididurans]|uniref:Flagellar hook-associated protein 1 n=1 Tax=Desulfosporosinus acididurans TaxID=476652 RepID=A0A0J1FQV9_9FIRM|nr:flagellar hook-associated protein FlgK [Desulfosporosinus acididurans]KLU65885.1 flagellar hook-associated protein 1 [Desulfosporosinus acididurans]
MTSTFFGLEIARRALNAQQAALNVTSNNISNANTTGYSRQIANLTETTPYTIWATGKDESLGSGVAMDTVTRARDKFVDMQLRNETSKQQYWTSRETSLTNIQSDMNEASSTGSGSGLSSDLNSFWTAWSDLSTDPQNSGSRAVVQETGVTLTDAFHSVYNQLKTEQSNTDSDINDQVSKINSYSKQIAALTQQIQEAERTGDNPNSLLDSRDNLIDELSKIVNVNVKESRSTDPNSNANVTDFELDIGDGSQVLVSNDRAYQLATSSNTSGIGGNTITSIKWANSYYLPDGTQVTIDSSDPHAAQAGTNLSLASGTGTLQSDIDIRDKDIPDLVSKYNTLAQGIVTAVNGIYNPSGTGTNFFNGTDTTAGDIALDSSVDTEYDTNVNNIVAGTSGSGDGSIASAIANLSSGWSTLSGTALSNLESEFGSASSLGGYYDSTVSGFGVKVQEATGMKTGEDTLVTNLTNQRDSVSGVSLDEEMTNMIQFQKSYTAAARVVTTLDDMLNTIVTGLGVTR